jgi:radical SAM protein with 4Fe4S-binding SPASM domain
MTQRETNRNLNILEYKTQALVLSSRPRYVVVELTEGCNLYCEMCRSERIGVGNSRMSRELFGEIADALFPTAELVDLRGWGESLILPDIIDLIHLTSEYGCEIRFVTNLSFRNDSVLRTLAEFNCFVAVSLDSADPATLESLRRGADFDRISSNLALLVRHYKNLRGTADRVAIHCTVQKPALDGLESIVDFAARVGISEIILASVSAPKKPQISLCGHDAEVQKALALISHAAARTGVRVIAATQFAGLPQNGPDLPHCIHPWSYAYINVNGEVGFCDHLIGPYAASYLVGDLRRSSFHEIWNSDKWQDLRKEHVGARRESAPLFKKCSWCYQHRYIDFEDAFIAECAERKVYVSAKPNEIVRHAEDAKS